MFPLLNRFHALQTADTPTRQIFARLSEQRLDVILADKAYTANVTKSEVPTASIKGSSRTLSTRLLSIVLSTPATTAAFTQNCSELVLTCVDKSSLRLVIAIPVLPTPSESLLSALHQSLITAVASLEAYLLATFGEHEHTDPTRDIHGLQTMHAVPRHGKDPINRFLPFRHMSAVSMSLLAARAFAAAQLAFSCRAEKLQKKQAMFELRKQQKKRERERVEQARRQKTYGTRKRSIFVEYKPEQDVEQQQQKVEQIPAHLTPHENDEGEKKELGEQKESAEKSHTQAEKKPSPEETHQPNRGQNQVTDEAAENKSAEPSSSMPKRKKRKKAKRLV